MRLASTLLLAALVASSTPAAAQDPSLELYRATLAAELDAGNNYPSGNMTRPRDAIERAIAASDGAQEDCLSAARDLLATIALMGPGVNSLQAASASYAQHLEWRAECEKALRLPASERPLEAGIALYLKP